MQTNYNFRILKCTNHPKISLKPLFLIVYYLSSQYAYTISTLKLENDYTYTPEMAYRIYYQWLQKSILYSLLLLGERWCQSVMSLLKKKKKSEVFIVVECWWMTTYPLLSLSFSVQDALIVAQLIVIITTMMTHFLRLQDIANLSLPLDILSSYHLSQTLTVIIPGSTFNNLHVSGTFSPDSSIS